MNKSELAARAGLQLATYIHFERTGQIALRAAVARFTEFVNEAEVPLLLASATERYLQTQLRQSTSSRSPRNS